MNLDNLIKNMGLQTVMNNPSMQSLFYSPISIPLLPGEKILWVGHRSLKSFFFYFILIVILCILFIIFLWNQQWNAAFFSLLLIAIIIGIIIFESRSVTYVITNVRIITDYNNTINKKIFNKQPVSIEIKNITKAQLKQNFIFRFLNIGTIIFGKKDYVPFIMKDPELALVLSLMIPWAGLFYVRRYLLALIVFVLWILAIIICMVVLMFSPLALFNPVSFFLTIAMLFIYLVLALFSGFTAYFSALIYNVKRIGGIFAIDEFAKISQNISSMMGRI